MNMCIPLKLSGRFAFDAFFAVEEVNKKRIFFEMPKKYKELLMTNDNVPFMIKSLTRLACHHSKDKKRKPNAANENRSPVCCFGYLKYL